MANELEVSYQGAATIYAVIRNKQDSTVWNAISNQFETWSDSLLSNYDLALNDLQGDLYQGDWPAIMAAGEYRIQYYRQNSSTPDLADLLLATNERYWNGSVVTSNPPTQIDLDALTTLEGVKRYMRISDNSDDQLLIELINQVSKRIELICNRHFKQATFREWHAGIWNQMLILKQYPAIHIHSIRFGQAVAIEANYTGTAIEAYLMVDASKVRLSTTDTTGQVTNTDLTFTSYGTTNNLVLAIAAVSGWSANSMINTPSSLLITTIGQDAKKGSISLAYPNQTERNYRVNLDTGTLHLTNNVSQQVLVEYDAGFANIPVDIDLATKELVAEAYHLGRHDTTAKRESLGEYSLSLTNAARLSHDVMTRLRPYIAIPTSRS